jgi:beta-lactamase regulating signal transducer with metallopeptidase domain
VISFFQLLMGGFPAAVTVLLAITAVLSIALLSQKWARRFPAVKHSILLVALGIVGLSPLLTDAVQRLNSQQTIRLPEAIALGRLLETPQATNPMTGTALSISPSGSPFLTMLLALWGAGVLFGLTRLSIGLRLVSRTHRAATPLTRDRSDSLRNMLVQVFGSNPPQILVSDRVGVPVALGFFRPAVILPTSLIQKFGDQDLYPILLHECAHAARRDAIIGFYQRLLAALLWFHPLVHFANKCLNVAREEVCDNFVLSSIPAQQYSKTLITIAQSSSPTLSTWLAPAFVQSPRQLENRIIGLLDRRRSLRTVSTTGQICLVAIVLFSVAVIVSACASSPDHVIPPSKISQTVHFKIGKTYVQSGDSITIDAVHGTSDTFVAGNLYQVDGRYKLVSRDKALLAAFVTAKSPSSLTPDMQTQEMRVTKGEGHFSLLFYMWQDGAPHVSFYPYPSGSSFAGVYFGSGIPDPRSAQ